MKPTEILMNEHRVIEQVLQCLGKMAAKLHREKVLDREGAKQAIDFFRNFADRCHHGKEEVHLFTWMEEKGFPRDGGPTGVMLHEHEQGRTYVRAMERIIDAAADGDEASQTAFVQNAQSFIQLLSQHIHKEDHCLFPMALKEMSQDEEKEMVRKFHSTEREDIGAGVHERYMEIADALAEKYGVEKAQLDKSAVSCSCRH